MPIRNYPFIKNKLLRKSYPLLPIKLVNPENNKHIITHGLIDSGADNCSIPAKFAEILGHNLKAGKNKQIMTGSGLSHAYLHTTIIDVFKYDYLKKKKIEVVYSTEADTIDYLPGLHIVLLGVKGFLENFKLIINYPEKQFSLKKF